VTNREIFVGTYRKIITDKFPNLTEGIVNDAVHGALIAINSKEGLSLEAFQAAQFLGIEQTPQAIVDYVYAEIKDAKKTKATEERTEDGTPGPDKS